jgi:hypothetical protein
MNAATLLGLPWWRAVCAAGLIVLCAPAHTAELQRAGAAEQPGAVAPPVEIGAAVPAARLQGFGTMRFLGMPIYDARLWSGTGFDAARYEGQTFALELRYARKLDGAAIAQRSIAEMRRSGDLDARRADAWLAAMTQAVPDVAPGDRLTGVYAPGEATRFFHNGRPTQVVADPAFGRLFFGIWLAGTTSEPSLRRQLIGAGS